MVSDDKKHEYELKTKERLFKLENVWDSTFFTNNILSSTELEISNFRIHIRSNSFRFVSLYFYDIDDLSCVFSSMQCRFNFRLYNNGTVLKCFSTNGQGHYKTKDKILISDLQDKNTAFALGTIYEDVPLMMRYLDLYKNLNILRHAIQEDVKDVSPVELQNNKNIIKLEKYRCLLSI